MKCKDGYAQKIGDVGERNVYCTEFGWSPILLQLIKCASEFPIFTRHNSYFYTFECDVF